MTSCFEDNDEFLHVHSQPKNFFCSARLQLTFGVEHHPPYSKIQRLKKVKYYKTTLKMKDNTNS